jgi:hypothetical protein
MTPDEIKQVNQASELIQQEKTTVFIDVDSGVELTTQVAS